MSKDNFEALWPAETQIPNILLDVFLQEASDLQEWSRPDQEKLI